MGALSGEVALITGGASGLGGAIVRRFVEEGAQVVAMDRSPERLAGLAAQYGSEVLAVQGDVRSLADNQGAVAAAVARFGKLDCAIGNAGIWDYAVKLDETPPDRLDAAFDEMFHVNVKGCVHLAKAALPALVRSRGSLIYTVSNAGFDPAGGGVLYTATKHALVGLIRQLAYEFAPVVRVNGVAPGAISSNLAGPAALGLEATEINTLDLEKLSARNVPLGIVPKAEDYTGGYVLMASRRDNRAATGGVVRLDTGIAVRGIGAPAIGGGLAAKYDVQG